MFYSLDFLRLVLRTSSKCPPSATVHSERRRLTERYTVWIVANGIRFFYLAKLDEHWISRYQPHENIASMIYLGIVQKNLHDCISNLVTSGTSLSSVLTFQHILLRSIDFKFVSDYCYCYPCSWWCIKFSPPTSLKFKNILHFPITDNPLVTTYVHRMITLSPCLFKHMKNDEHVAVLFQCLLDHTQYILYFCLISLLRNNVSKSVCINLRHSVFLSHFVAGK